MRYYVGAATGKGSFTVDAEDVELTDEWVIFRNEGKVEHAFNRRLVTSVSRLDEAGEPRMNMHIPGMNDYVNLPA